MDKLKELMAKRVAGIPVTAIALLVALGALWYALRLKGTDKDSATIDDTTDIVAEDLPELTDVNPPTFTAPSPNQTGSVTSFAQDDNDAWTRRATEWLVANQGVNPAAAQSALVGYINGDSLTYEQGQWVSKVWSLFGPPPELPSAPGGWPDNPPTPGTSTTANSTAYNTVASIAGPVTAVKNRPFTVKAKVTASASTSGRPTGHMKVVHGKSVIWSGSLPASGQVTASPIVKNGGRATLQVFFDGSGKWKNSQASTSVTVR